MTRPSVLFFDVGDTLVFDDPPIALRFAQAAHLAGYAVSPALLPESWRAAERVGLSAYLHGTDTDHGDVQRRSAAAVLGVLGYPAPTDTQWQALASAFAAVPFVRYIPPQALALLETLRGKGVRLGIISDWEETLPDVLDQLGILQYFESLSVSALVGFRKPDARLFQQALAQMNVLAADTLHIGDWYELDVQGAQNAGIPALLFDHAGRSPDRPCLRVETFDALAVALEQFTRPRNLDGPTLPLS